LALAWDQLRQLTSQRPWQKLQGVVGWGLNVAVLVFGCLSFWFLAAVLAFVFFVVLAFVFSFCCFMPTGGSVPYTWTIYANAFRVADTIIAGLGGNRAR
jgi:hypothetical protein